MTTAPRSSLNPGKLAVLGILLLAVGLAGSSWWWNWQRTVRCREFYGGEGANLIRTATDVEALLLSPYLSGIREQEELTVGSRLLAVAQRRDLSKAPGFIHARTALLDDQSYDWEDRLKEDCVPYPLESHYAVRFRDSERQMTLVFEFDCRTVRVAETQQRVTLAPKIASGWESYLTRQFFPATEQSSKE